MTAIEMHRADINTNNKRPVLYKEYMISPCEKYAYCLVCKNGTNTFRKAFARIGWTSTKVKQSNKIFFTHIRDPLDRWVRGVTQFALFQQIEDLSCFLNPIGIFDNHTFPISHVWLEHYNEMEFLPLDIGNAYEHTNNFLHGNYVIDTTLEHHNTADEHRKKKDMYAYLYDNLTEAQKHEIRTGLYYNDSVKYDDIKFKYRNLMQ